MNIVFSNNVMFIRPRKYYYPQSHNTLIFIGEKLETNIVIGVSNFKTTV